MVRPKAQFKGDGAWVKPPDFSLKLRQALREFCPLEHEKEEFTDHILAAARGAISALQHQERDVLKGEALAEIAKVCEALIAAKKNLKYVADILRNLSPDVTIQVFL